MQLTAEVKGKSADRFRAYKAVKLLRKPAAVDHINRAGAKLPPFEPGTRIRYNGEDVALEGSVVDGEAVKITADKDTTITRVVFYKGPVETESVVGSVEINASGDFEIELVEPVVEDPAKPPIVDEE